MTAESGQYAITCNREHTGVVISFSVIGEGGVETFKTAMSPAEALIFGQRVVAWATHMLGE